MATNQTGLLEQDPMAKPVDPAMAKPVESAVAAPGGAGGTPEPAYKKTDAYQQVPTQADLDAAGPEPYKSEPYRPEGFDSKGMLDAQMEDINRLTAQDSPLMRQAETAGKQYAQERGLLSSSMAAGAVEAERLKAVMPLVQQTAGQRGQFALQDYAQKHDVVMQGLDTESKEKLIGIEQEWNQIIQSDVNAAAFWQTSIDGLMDIFNNPDMDAGQQLAARNEMLGYTDATGEYHPGTVYAGLDFLRNLSGTGARPGGAGTAQPGGAPESPYRASKIVQITDVDPTSMQQAYQFWERTQENPEAINEPIGNTEFTNPNYLTERGYDEEAGSMYAPALVQDIYNQIVSDKQANPDKWKTPARWDWRYTQ